MNKQLVSMVMIAVVVGFCSSFAYGETNNPAYTNNATTNTTNAPDIKKMLEKANNGDAKAQCILGYCYEHGKGVAQDYTNAVMWYRKSADQGDAKAQRNLGSGYYYGLGVPQDYAEAIRWERKAADQGNDEAQFNLGTYFYNGKGVAQDYTEAIKWFRKSAEQGFAMAQCCLGACYDRGNGVAKDHEEAIKWFRKAADKGNTEAKNYLKTVSSISTNAISELANSAANPPTNAVIDILPPPP